MQYRSKIEELQETWYGNRFIGATLSEITILDGSNTRNVLEWIKKKKNFMVVMGPPGTGKTYLCSALVEYMFEMVSCMRCYHERDLLRRIRSGFSQSSTGDYIEHLHSLIDDELIILDDLGSSGHTDWREEVLFETIDYRYGKMLPTVVTTNLTAQEIHNIYSDRLSSRLFARENTIIDYHGLTDLRCEGK